MNISSLSLNYCSKIQNNSISKLNVNNKVSFKGSEIEEKFAILKPAVIDYVMNTDCIDNERLKEIINKVCENTSIGDFSSLNTSSNNITDASAGYISQPQQLIQTIFGPRIVPLEPQKICVKNLPFDKNGEKNRILYARRFLHEATHALQEEADYPYSVLPLVNNYLSENNNFQNAVANIQAAPKVFKTIEQFMYQRLFSTNFKIEYKPKNISRYQDLNNLIFKKYRASMATVLGSDLDSMLAKLGRDVDKKFLKQYVNYKAHQEKDAYINEIAVAKELYGIEGRTDYDILLEAYDALIQATEN